MDIVDTRRTYMWSKLYDQSNQPTMDNINEYIKNELFPGLCSHLENTYNVLPKIEYSKCSMQRGWNIKYKKSGKSLCTIYPENGSFIVLVVIGEKESEEAESIMPACNDYIRRLYYETPSPLGGKWLMIEVKERAILNDVLKLIEMRIKPKNKAQ
jgi:hypothetical protein